MATMQNLHLAYTMTAITNAALKFGKKHFIQIKIHHKHTDKIYSVQNSAYALRVINTAMVQRFKVMSDKCTTQSKISEGS